MTVYVIQKPFESKGWTPDLSSAESFGEIEYIFDSSDKIYQDPVKFLKIADEKLYAFDQETDYICYASRTDPCSVLLVGMVLGNRDKIKYLHWNRKKGEDGKRSSKEGSYMDFTIDLIEAFGEQND